MHLWKIQIDEEHCYAMLPLHACFTLHTKRLGNKMDLRVVVTFRMVVFSISVKPLKEIICSYKHHGNGFVTREEQLFLLSTLKDHPFG